VAVGSSDNTLVPRGRTPTGSQSTPGLPTDVVSQSAARLRVLALLYAGVFVMAGYFPAFFFPADRAHLFSSAVMWAPGVIAIAVALTVAAILHSARVRPSTVLTIGLIFEVVGSYGIAASEFLDPGGLSPKGWFGLSWVAVWTQLFTVVIPTPPRRAVVAALASVSAVPVIIGIEMLVYPFAIVASATHFFFGLVFPYLLVVVMAYVGARVVYSLGAEVSRARELGSYQLESKLGQGGMGEVWSARHRMLARPAAIKLIRPSLAGDARFGISDDARRRFEREAQAIASLRSPHTVHLFDFGIAQDGTFFYVMELLDGLNVDELVRQTGPVPAERAVYLVRQVCHSLSEAEWRGLVHRDIKPANIFLCRYGQDEDFVKVLDFGIVKAAASPGATTGLSIDNAIQGTPAFMAPEQAVGGAVVDARADIYAVGCVAYWLLTGELVFSADRPLGLVMHHVHTAPAPPSSRTELPIPVELDRIVLACLAKDPAARPQSARELSERLAAVPFATPWTTARAHQWWATHQPSKASLSSPG
jgi:serine/threonine-protein kinase